MDSVIYLEPDEEITSVIDKLKQTKSPVVGIVAPRNAVLLQSVVNLKLLKKQAAALKKDVSLVTADRIGQNLALRTGLTVYGNIHDSEPLTPPTEPRPETFIEDDSPKASPASSNSGFKVRRYDERNDIVDATPQSDQDEEEESAATPPPVDNFSARPIGEAPKQSVPDEEPEEVDDEEESEPEPESKTVLNKKSPVNPAEKMVKPKDTPKVTEFHPDSALEPRKEKTNYAKVIIVLVVFVVIIAAIGYLALTSTSKATVNIVVASEPISQKLDVTVNKDATAIDANKNIIPGRLLESDQQATQKVTATGKKDVGQKAAGKMTVTNETGISQSFETGTAFKSSAGLIFRSNKAFTVPAATPTIDKTGNVSKINGTVTIDVTANEAGDKYNVSATDYSLTGYTMVHGQGSDMQGGATKQITVVSQTDLDKATADITKDLVQKAQTDLKNKTGDAILYTGAIQNDVVDTTADAAAGDQVDDFNLTVKTKSSVLVYDRGDLNDLIQQVLTQKTPADKSLLATDTKNLKITVISSNPVDGVMKLSTTATGDIIPKLDKTTLQKNLAGKTKAEVASYFAGQSSDIKEVDTELTPSWFLKKIPATPSKVTINITTQK